MLSRKAYRLGLTGWPLGHSLSPGLHRAALHALGLEGEYRLYPIPPGDPSALAGLLGKVRSGELHGLNVTIPHKQAVITGLDRLTSLARATGAVNTVFFEGDDLVGDNTDAPGFALSLRHFLESSPQLQSTPASAANRALVLGAGGAARAVVYALVSAGWRVGVAARRVEQARALADGLQPAPAQGGPISAASLEPDAVRALVGECPPDLVVNATPAGMAPDVLSSPWPSGVCLPPRAAVYDLVYNPRETKLLREARAAGLPASGGISMLVEQAALAFERWTGRSAPREPMYAAVDETAPKGSQPRPPGSLLHEEVNA